MTVSSRTYETQISAAIVRMAAACAAWADYGRSQIAENWGGEEGRGVDGTVIDKARTWLIVWTQGVRETEVGWGTTIRTGSASLVISSRPQDTDAPAEAVRRCTDLAGDLVDQMRAQLGTAGALVYATFEIGETVVTDPGESGNSDSERPRELETTITIDWKEIP